VTEQPRPLRLLRIAIVLALVFDLMALLVLVRATPIIFTMFMFLAQPLFAAALVLLLGAVLAELRARQLL
jgi:hypothetical protein